MVLTFDIDTLLISIFDNIVSNQEIHHFGSLWPYISKVLHFWSSWLLTYLRISLGTVWAIFLWNIWLRLKCSLSISCHFVLMLFFFYHFLLILPSMDRFLWSWCQNDQKQCGFLPNRTLWATIHACVLEHPIKRKIFTFEKWILPRLVAMATK